MMLALRWTKSVSTPSVAPISGCAFVLGEVFMGAVNDRFMAMRRGACSGVVGTGLEAMFA